MEGYPAYAGIDPFKGRYKRHDGGLPRIRGDRPQQHSFDHLPFLATPHTRGSTPACVGVVGSVAGYPAYAGIDLFAGRLRWLVMGLPRIRGDRPVSVLIYILTTKATPHTRGSTVQRNY